MKGKGFTTVLFILLLFTVSAALFSISNAQEKVYQVGDRGPAGGWIFYDKGSYSNGWRYLEAASEDVGRDRWGCPAISISGAKGTALGTGKSNTDAIVRGCSAKITAAKLVASYRGGRKKDWYLPSKDELNIMFDVLIKRNLVNFGDTFYWSSTEVDKDKAMKVGSFTRKVFEEGENNLSYIYPIRAF